MKKLLVFLGVAMSLAFVSCKEEPPYINHQVPKKVTDSTYITPNIPPAQPKEILIEDVSGVSCKNCPEAARIGHDLAIQHPNRINIVTIYPNIRLANLTDPVKVNGVESRFDLRTDVGKDVVNYVTVPPSLPCGYINRKKMNTTTGWYVSKDDWSGVVTNELALSTPVNIDITNSYAPASQKLTVKVKITYTQAVTGSNYIHVMLLQDSTIDAQETTDPGTGNTTYDSVYVHQHALMDMLTANNGDLLNTSDARSLVAGRVFELTYEKVFEPRNSSPTQYPQPQWRPEHVKIVAFVTEDATTKYVLQSKETDLQ